LGTASGHQIHGNQNIAQAAAARDTVRCPATAVYHHAMSRRHLLESPPPPSSGTEEDVEPYFPEPLVELDLDTLE
jgi:hypothetical protein